MSKERLDNSVLDNAISTPVLDKVTLALLEELKQYRDLEEQGLLLRLPCKVGDTVWEIVDECEGNSAGCCGFCDACHNKWLAIKETRFSVDMMDAVGNWFFLTQSEAEEKLRELEGK